MVCRFLYCNRCCYWWWWWWWWWWGWWWWFVGFYIVIGVVIGSGRGRGGDGLQGFKNVIGNVIGGGGGLQGFKKKCNR